MSGEGGAPRLVIRIAVTGHRPPVIQLDREPQLRSAIRSVLEEVFEIAEKIRNAQHSAYSEEAARFRVLSSLAEGSDRLVAEEAVHFGLSLECPLPAHFDEYRSDFESDASKQQFKTLYDAASSCFELDGIRQGRWLRSSDYRRAGHIAASNSDLLIAIWDKQPGAEGGTGQIAREAADNQMPVLRIDPRDASIEFLGLKGQWESHWRKGLTETLERNFESPKGSREWIDQFACERCARDVEDRERADELATRYGKFYRASYFLKYLLAACAVAFAAIALALGEGTDRVWSSLELTSIVGILISFAVAARWKWHARWLDYRLLAEQFRVFGFLEPLGEAPPVFNPPAYWGAPPGRHACVRWYFRARIRELPTPTQRVDSAYVQAQKSLVLRVTRDQFRYHFDRHRAAELRHRVLQVGGVVAFALTLIACAFHFVKWFPAAMLGALTAALPAFGAAMEGIGAQEESQRISKYSFSMSKHLETVERELDALEGEQGLGPLASIAFQLATEMTRETSGWHNLIHGQPPRLS